MSFKDDQLLLKLYKYRQRHLFIIFCKSIFRISPIVNFKAKFEFFTSSFNHYAFINVKEIANVVNFVV